MNRLTGWTINGPIANRDRLEATALWRVQNAAETLDKADTLDGISLIDFASLRLGSQADLARASGMTQATISVLKKRAKVNRAQRAAINWALTQHALAL